MYDRRGRKVTVEECESCGGRGLQYAIIAAFPHHAASLPVQESAHAMWHRLCRETVVKCCMADELSPPRPTRVEHAGGNSLASLSAIGVAVLAVERRRPLSTQHRESMGIKVQLATTSRFDSSVASH